jgi:mannose-6-phosphate isomerase-like protein (cupin superfamily)
MAATTETNIAPFQVAKVRPQLVSKGKTSDRLVTAGNLGIGVQVAAGEAGDTNLHSHPNSDSAWMVMGGKAIFYTVGDKVIAELGKYEMVSIPAGTPYWFDNADKGGENLVILHITSKIPTVSTGRIDYTPRETGGDSRIREVIPDKFFGDD